MIIIKFLQWVLGFLSGSHFSVDFNGSITGTILSIYKLIAYVLPMDTVVAIIVITMALYAIRIVISAIRLLWELIPML